MTTAEYPIAEVQGLYRTIAELRQQVASADLIRADAMERMAQQDQTIDALKHIADIAHAGGLAAMTELDALVAIRHLSLPYWDTKRPTGPMHLAVLGALSCRHVDTRSTKPRKAKA